MVRKTKEQAHETYCALLDAAEREFRAKGVTRTTLADIAAAASMTRGAIYWHFKDKNAVFEAMCDRAFLPMESLLNEIAAMPEKDPKCALSHLTTHLLLRVANDARQRTVFEILFHRCEKNEDMQFFANEKTRRAECLERVEGIYKNAVAQGKLPANTDTYLATHAMHGYLMGLIHEWLVDPDAYDLAQHAVMLMDIFLTGLFIKPPLKTEAPN